MWQLALEKEESEREKWEIIKRARESAERAVVLRTQLDAREQTIRELQDEVAKVCVGEGGGARGGLVGALSPVTHIWL